MRGVQIPKYLTQEEVTALFSTIKDVRDRAIFRLMYHFGLRRSEPGLLDLGDYRAGANRLYVRRLKGSNSGEFPVPELAARSLRAWIRERGAAPGPLFPSRERGRITGRRLDQLMKKYCAAAGIAPEKAHCHSLKHSCGTHLFEMGEGVADVQDQLGHRNVQNTMIYLHITNQARVSRGERLRAWGKRN